LGCAHRVEIRSEPLGAQVRMRGRAVGATPVEVVLWSVPFAHPEARLTMPGFRGVQINLRRDRRPLRRFGEFLTFRWRRAFALSPGAHHEVLLVPDHGPAGTWGPEEVGG
jgi:hypothetical protein